MQERKTGLRAFWAVAGNKILGLGFLTILGAALVLLVAQFNQAFDPNPRVTLIAPTAGNQLNRDADVKVRGLIIGRVAAQHAANGVARLSLSIKSSDLAMIPANVSARILPKTLFGEKYVDLVLPATPVGHLKGGDTIPIDRSASAIEVEHVLRDFFPLLRAIQPEKLQEALGSLSSALQGRGQQLGDTLTQFNTYLAGLEPSLPIVEQDLSGFADLATNLDTNAADLLTILHNASITGQTLTGKEDLLASFLRGTAGFASTATSVLTADETRLIGLAATTRPTVETLSIYRNNLPPTVRSLNTLLDELTNPSSGALAQGPFLDLKMPPATSRGAYTVADCPRYPGLNGPDCVGAPAGGAPVAGGAGSQPAAGTSDPLLQKKQLDAVLSPILGLAPSQIPDVTGLLYSTLLRGAVVSTP